MSKFTEVLRNRNFFFLWLGQIISQLGDRLDQMALIGFVYSRTQGGAGSAIGIAKILAFTLIPVFLIGPLAGVYVDRWDRRRTMYVCDLLRAFLVLLIPLFLFYAKNITLIYFIIFLVFSIGRFFVPAKLSILPELIGKKDLVIGNSLINITGMIASIVGFGISGIIVERWGAKSGFYLDSLSFLISGTLIFLIAKRAMSKVSISEVSKEIVEVIRKSVLQEIKEGFVYFLKKKDIRLTAGIIFALWSALGAVYVVVIVFVQRTLGTMTKDLGLLAMCMGLGLFAGSLLFGKLCQRVSLYKSIFLSLVLCGLMVMAFALLVKQYPYFSIAAALAFFLGVLVSPIMIASNTIIHKVSESEMMGKIFSSLEIVMHLGFLACMFLTSYLAERYAHQSILITVGVLIALLGAVNLVCFRKLPWFE